MKTEAQIRARYRITCSGSSYRVERRRWWGWRPVGQDINFSFMIASVVAGQVDPDTLPGSQKYAEKYLELLVQQEHLESLTKRSFWRAIK